MIQERISFKDEFVQFLNENSFSFEERAGDCFYFSSQNLCILLMPLEPASCSPDMPTEISWQCPAQSDIIYLYEDRWFFNKELIKKRILSRLGVFTSVFARKCKVITDSQVKADSRINRRISDFLDKFHSYGNAKCSYRYALEYDGEIVAAATFSAPRPMPRQMATPLVAATYVFDSYEWVRYASLPDVRVVGGMGRLFKAFLEDAEGNGNRERPLEVMTYSDTEWSSGDVYEKLGFRLVQERKPVEFYVHKETCERVAKNKVSPHFECGDTYVKISNKGSRKYLYNCSAIDWQSLV
jgi:hypothetical protein